MSSVPPDILQRIIDDFGDDQAVDIYDYLLAKIPDGLANGTRPRHLRCILFLTNGDRKQLDVYINMCLCDTRDVMLAAEYVTVDGSGLVRQRDFSQPFGNCDIK